ncbi:hypothetical protein D3C77_272130 [compost metagenome]
MESLVPGVALLRQRAVVGNRDAFVLDVDVPFPGADTLAVGDQHGRVPVMVLVGGQTNDMARVAIAQVVDLIQMQFVILAGVERNAVVDGQRDIALFKVADNVIQILLRCTTGGDDGRAARRCNFLDQRPVVHVGTGDLEDGHVEFDTQINRCLVERRGHGNATQIPDFLDHSRKFSLAELGVFGFLDVAQLRIAFEVRMNKLIDITKLQLDGRLDVIETRNCTVITDDFQPAFQPAPVIVGKFQDEQVLK